MTPIYRTSGFLLSLAGFLAVSVYLLISGYFMYPMMDGDAGIFVPPMLSWAQSRELLNPAIGIREFDPDGLGRFVYHGFLFPILVGTLSPVASYVSIRMIIILFIISNLGMSLFLFWRFLGMEKESPLKKGALIFFALTGATTALAAPGYRPDILATFLILAGCHIFFASSKKNPAMIAGCVLGLLGVTHMTAAVLAGLLYALLVAIFYEQNQSIKILLSTAVIALAVFSATFLFYPYPAIDFFRAHWFHAVSNFSQSKNLESSSQFLKHWLWNPYATGFGILYGLAGIFLFRKIIRQFRNIKWKIGFLIFFGLLSLLIYRFSFSSPRQNYNLTLFAPFIYLQILIWAFNKKDASDAALLMRLKEALKIALVLSLFLINSIGIFRDIVLFPFFLKYGLSYRKAQTLIAQIQNDCESVLLDKGLFPFVTRPEKTSVITDRGMGYGGPMYWTCIVGQQANRSSLTPWDIDGYALIENYLSPVVPAIGGIKIANTVRGYNFVRYRKK